MTTQQQQKHDRQRKNNNDNKSRNDDDKSRSGSTLGDADVDTSGDGSPQEGQRKKPWRIEKANDRRKLRKRTDETKRTVTGAENGVCERAGRRQGTVSAPPRSGAEMDQRDAGRTTPGPKCRCKCRDG